MALSLSLGGLNVTLIKFTDSQLPRAIIEPHAGMEYSIWGTSIGDGPVFEPRYLWTVSAYVDRSQERLIGAIHQEFDRLRRLRQDATVRLIDTNQEIQAPNLSRAIAPDTTATDIGAGYFSYFAQFDTWFVSPPKLSEQGIIRTVEFSLQEAIQVNGTP